MCVIYVFRVHPVKKVFDRYCIRVIEPNMTQHLFFFDSQAAASYRRAILLKQGFFMR